MANFSYSSDYNRNDNESQFSGSRNDGRSYEAEEKFDRDEFMNRVKAENAAANYETFITKLILKCFNGCIQKPGQSLDRYESACLNKCADRYVETWQLVGNVYKHRLYQMYLADKRKHEIEDGTLSTE